MKCVKINFIYKKKCILKIVYTIIDMSNEKHAFENKYACFFSRNSGKNRFFQGRYGLLRVAEPKKILVPEKK